MQGVDGNYLKMQGEMLARLQVGLQAEAQAQQTRAQSASEEALRRLREQVVEMEASRGEDRGPSVIDGRSGRSAGNRPGNEGSRTDGSESRPANEEGEIIPPPPGLGSRIDARA